MVLLGGRIYRARKILGLRQDEISNQSGISKSVYSNLENDACKSSRATYIAVIVAILYFANKEPDLGRRKYVLDEVLGINGTSPQDILTLVSKRGLPCKNWQMC